MYGFFLYSHCASAGISFDEEERFPSALIENEEEEEKKKIENSRRIQWICIICIFQRKQMKHFILAYSRLDGCEYSMRMIPHAHNTNRKNSYWKFLTIPTLYFNRGTQSYSVKVYDMWSPAQRWVISINIPKVTSFKTNSQTKLRVDI